jgi:hypothetical protein
MVKRSRLLLAFAGIILIPAVGDARPHQREQDEAFRGTRDGRIMPLRVIESRVIPQMRGAQYLGPELDVASARYRLKFMRGGQVIWIDVDGRTGEVLARSGN